MQKETKTKKKFFKKKISKICKFCKDKNILIDYKNVELLEKFITNRGKIKARRLTGNCAKHQNKIRREVKIAREMAILPFVSD